jgi:hypothetical protein
MAVKAFPISNQNDIKSMTHEQFIARSNFGSVSGTDLYWVMYRAATETGASGSADTFCTKVLALLTERLGSGRFGVLVNINPRSNGGSFELVTTLLPNNQFWAGDAGVLPGFGAANSLTCLVWWN